MPEIDIFAEEILDGLRAESLFRAVHTCISGGGVRVERDGKNLLSFAGNDYLGLSQHPKVIAAAKTAMEKYGIGAGASRLITGSHKYYEELEALLAGVKGTESAVVFGSGYLANVGVITSLVGKSDMVVADRLVHASIIDAIKLSGAALSRYSHNDLSSLSNRLKNREKYRNCLVVTESVFSMDGDVTPLAAIREIADENDAWLMTDDAHGFGVVDVPQVADIQVGTLSKAVGCYGGYACASYKVIELLQNKARSLIYSTALPPAVVAAACEAVKIIRGNGNKETVPLQKSRLFTSLMGLNQAESAIVPVVVGEAEKALELSSKLEEKGFLVPAIRQPTVPKGTARLRFSFSSLHNDEDIERLAKEVKYCG